VSFTLVCAFGMKMERLIESNENRSSLQFSSNSISYALLVSNVTVLGFLLMNFFLIFPFSFFVLKPYFSIFIFFICLIVFGVMLMTKDWMSPSIKDLELFHLSSPNNNHDKKLIPQKNKKNDIINIKKLGPKEEESCK